MMKQPSNGVLIGAGFGVVALALVLIGAPHDRPPPTPIETRSPLPPLPSVSAGGVTLVSDSIDMPADDATYPDGPHADVINANCISCHSASMALSQSALSADQWTAEVTKMREVYKAPVPESAVPDIVAYLTAMPSQKAAPATGKAQDPDPKAAPDVSGGTG